MQNTVSTKNICIIWYLISQLQRPLLLMVTGGFKSYTVQFDKLATWVLKYFSIISVLNVLVPWANDMIE